MIRSPSTRLSPAHAPTPVRTLGLGLLAIGLAVLPTTIARAATGKAAMRPDAALQAAIASPDRDPAFAKRDEARHPAQELTFFGLKPNHTVVEIWPSGGYWTEILAPYLHDHGTYYAAGGAPMKPDSAFAHKLAAQPARYDHVKITQAAGAADIAPANSVDLVVTFRNLHNWMKQGDAPQMLAAFYRALKPGGILGIEDHRGHRTAAYDPQAKDGYVSQDSAIAQARAAGFRFVASSEMDANPKDTADWPKGVWTLPPTFALGAQDHDRYAAIGEADNFVLKFRKP
ncbi:MAG: class I SAM-dependent methyltransferase [Janthinobacterium lividum]